MALVQPSDLDNFPPAPDAPEQGLANLKVMIKRLNQVIGKMRPRLCKSNALLLALLPLLRQALSQLSPAQEDLKVELSTTLKEVEAHLRDQEIKIP